MPSGEAAARESSAIRFVRSALLDRLPLKAVALFFAFVLWLAVSADEPGEQTVAVRLALRVDSSLSLRGEQPFVTATLTGRRRDLLKVRPGDLVLRRTIGPATADSARLVLRPTDVELPAGAEGEVRVRDVQPRQITLRFAHADSASNAEARSVGARPLAARPHPAAVTAPVPLTVDGDESAWRERAADTAWAASGSGVPHGSAPPGSPPPGNAPPATTPMGSTPADSAPRAAGRPDAGRPDAGRPAEDSAVGGPPPSINIRRSDSAAITNALPAGASRRPPADSAPAVPGSVPGSVPARPPRVAP